MAYKKFLSYELRFKKYIFQKNITTSSAGDTSTFKPFQDEMKDRAFNLDSKNINQGIGVRQTFIFEINIQEFFC